MNQSKSKIFCCWLLALVCFVLTPGQVLAQTSDDDDMNGVPTYCHYTNGGRTIQAACRGFDVDQFVETVTKKLEQKEKTFKNEKEKNKWLRSQRVLGICVFQTQWYRANLVYDESSAKKYAIKKVNSCDSGVTMQVLDKEDVVGPSLNDSKVKKYRYVVKLKGGDSKNVRKLYYASPYFNANGSKPVIPADHLAMNCIVNNDKGGEKQYLQCGADPNSSSHCHLKFFAEPTKRFQYKGYWWVRGPSRGPAAGKEMTVCSGGLDTQLAQEAANERGKNVGLYKEKVDTNLNFTNAIAKNLYTKGEFLEDAVVADPANAGYNYYRVSKCYALNPKVGKKLWYECTNDKGDGEEQGLDGININTEVDGATSTVVATDNNRYKKVDHAKSEGSCIIRAPMDDVTIEEFEFKKGKKTYIAGYSSGKYSVEAYEYQRLNKAGNVVTKTVNLTPKQFNASTYGPFAPAGAGAVGLALTAGHKANGDMVSILPCEKVEYLSRKVVAPATDAAP